MEIRDLKYIANWIKQFDLVDTYAAEHLLQLLHYVSFEEFEQGITEVTLRLIEDLQKNGNSAIALFPVKKNNENTFNQEKETKENYDSSGRIGHALTNLERALDKSSVELAPRIESMRAKKVKHIIFVDDIIGSGERIKTFWRTSVPKSVKSWVSGGYCQIWLVSYAAYNKGVKFIEKSVPALSGKIKTVIDPISTSPIEQNKKLVSLIDKYGSRTKKPDARFGFGKCYNHVVFQHGCPNNSPGILWANGKPNKRRSIDTSDRWDALFSERSIALDLYPLFRNQVSFQSYPELLWDLQQQQLALNFLESDESEAKVNILILALVHKGYSRGKIYELLSPIQSEVKTKIESLIKNELISKGMKITQFGNDVLLKNKKKNKYGFVDKEYEDFYPSSFLGLLRDV